MTTEWNKKRQFCFGDDLSTGRVVTYSPDVTGKITNVSTTLNGNQVNLASSVSYYPYGGVGGLTYGNGLLLTHVYDNQYRASSIAGQRGQVSTIDKVHMRWSSTK